MVRRRTAGGTNESGFGFVSDGPGRRPVCRRTQSCHGLLQSLPARDSAAFASTAGIRSGIHPQRLDPTWSLIVISQPVPTSLKYGFQISGVGTKILFDVPRLSGVTRAFDHKPAAPAQVIQY